MITQQKYLKTAMAVLLGSLTTVVTSFALGFRNPDQGARATAQGEAFVAQADDASAIYYNPAGLTQVKGTQVTSGILLGWPSWKYTGAGGSDEMNTGYMLPHIYVASDFGFERWRFGLGYNIPFGNSAEYDVNGPLVGNTKKAELAVHAISPGAAYRFNDQLSLGVVLNVYYGTTMTSSSPFGPGTEAHFRGDGATVGATVGLLWKINARNSVGVVYRSPFAIDFEGHARLSPFDPSRDNGSATIDFPQSIAVGYAFRPLPRWKLEADIEWTNWDTLNTLLLRAPGSLMDGTAVPFDWEDSFFYEFGTEYQVNDRWALRAGYIFSENSVPTSTLSPSVPDADRHVFSAGVGYKSSRLEVDLAYQYSLSDDRDVAGSVNSPDGRWETSAHAVMISSTWKF